MEAALRGRNISLIGFILICGAISYYDLKRCKRLPWPPRFIFAGLAFLMMELVSFFDESLGNVTTIGFVIATFVGDGFVKECEHGVLTTGQPQDTTLVGDVTGNTSPQSGGMASVAEYQQAQGAAIPGGITQQPGTTIV